MRFSIAWALAAMAYVALAAAAIGQASPTTAYVILAITGGAGCFAILEICYARGEQRARAIGFALLFAANLLCIVVAPGSVPFNVVLAATDYGVGANGQVFETGPRGQTLVEWPVSRTANAAGTMMAGLVGSVLGTVAYRRHRKPD